MSLENHRDAARVDAAQRSSLVTTYNEMFEVVRADTAELRDECFRIRHQVYCVENNFLPVERSDGMEIDRHDARSLHGLLRFRRTGGSVGTIRLVLPDPAAGDGSLPMYEACTAAGVSTGGFPPVANTAEISRFAISKQFRSRAGDDLYGRAYTQEELQRDERRIIPHMTLGLMGLAMRLSRDSGFDNVCAIMEPALIRLLERVGVRWTAIGQPIEYHGMRQPCIKRVNDLLAGVQAERHEVWEVIADTAASASQPAPGGPGAGAESWRIRREMASAAPKTPSDGGDLGRGGRQLAGC
jgi:N-acyl amino acid synthase of PEP-CTERM/exosortase system